VGVTQGLFDLVAVALAAAITPIVVAVLPGPRIPRVVIFLLGGILIGPHVLGLADVATIKLLANIGLGFLFLLAGYELDPQLLRERPGQLAIVGWLISAAIAVAVTAGLTRAVQAGTAKVLLCDSERLAAAAAEAGVEVTLEIGEGLPTSTRSCSAPPSRPGKPGRSCGPGFANQTVHRQL
jgi:Kef-type K+ transport system membrane component KefB